MKAKKWLLGLGVLCLLAILLSGCVSTSDYEMLNATYQSLQADYTNLQTDYASLQEKCPPRNFNSLTELETWLAANNISEEAKTTYADAWMRKALRLQKDAINDGYIISVDYDYDPVSYAYSVYCTTVIGGKLFYWDPETDDVLESYEFVTLE